MELGYDDPEVERAKWLAERTAVVNCLRRECQRVGDNTWPDNLNLVDVIEKNLVRPLESSRRRLQERAGKACRCGWVGDKEYHECEGHAAARKRDGGGR
jgi:hypothetical protein